MPDRPVDDPIRHTQQIKERLQELRDHLREDVTKVDEPKAEALFETAAETLDGLIKAFDDYEGKDEPAWKDL